MAIGLTEYIKGLFDLEIVDKSVVYVLEKKPREDTSYSQDYVVSATDLFDKEDNPPPVRDKEFFIKFPCCMFLNLEDEFQVEYINDIPEPEKESLKDSDYTGFRYRITKK